VSAHLEAGRAPLLASLAPTDAERLEAEAHARDCSTCAAELRGAAAVLAALDALPPPPPPSAQVLDRAARAVLAAWDEEAAPSIATSRPRVILALSALAAWGIALLTARHRDAAGAPAAIAGAAVAAAGALLLVARDRLALGALLLGSASFAVALGGPGALRIAAGLPCAVHELACAAAPLVAAAWLARFGRASIGPLGFAAAAAAGAVAGQAAHQMTCADGSRAHLLAFHFGSVAVAALAGAALGRLGGLQKVRADA
jgi:hypothetical protein